MRFELIDESLQLHNELNQKIWNGTKLRDDVNRKLQETVSQVIAELEANSIPVNLIDARIVGSNASYNYSANSDIDLHLVVDVGAETKDPYVLNLLYAFFKSHFNDSYDIKIKDINVEVYIEDIDTTVVSNGIYSLLNNRWIKFPVPIEEPLANIKAELQVLSNKYKDIIKKDDDSGALNLLNDIYLLRKDSIAQEGEFGRGNLIFKEFREKGYISRLKKMVKKGISKELSLESLKRISWKKLREDDEEDNPQITYRSNHIPQVQDTPKYHEAYDIYQNIYYDSDKGSMSYSVKKDLVIKAQPEEKRIDPEKIVTIQTDVVQKELDKYLKKPVEDFDAITVMQYKDKYFLIDGNHRVEASLINNEPEIKAKIYQFEDVKKAVDNIGLKEGLRGKNMKFALVEDRADAEKATEDKQIPIVSGDAIEREVPIAKLATTEDKLDRKKIAVLLNSNPDDWDPIKVVALGRYYVITDGNHRAQAAAELERERINAIVYGLDQWFNKNLR